MEVIDLSLRRHNPEQVRGSPRCRRGSAVSQAQPGLPEVSGDSGGQTSGARGDQASWHRRTRSYSTIAGDQALT